MRYFPEYIIRINKENKTRMDKYIFYVLHTKETPIFHVFFHTVDEYMKRSATSLLIRQKHVKLCECTSYYEKDIDQEKSLYIAGESIM